MNVISSYFDLLNRSHAVGACCYLQHTAIKTQRAGHPWRNVTLCNWWRGSNSEALSDLINPNHESLAVHDPVKHVTEATSHFRCLPAVGSLSKSKSLFVYLSKWTRGRLSCLEICRDVTKRQAAHYRWALIANSNKRRPCFKVYIFFLEKVGIYFSFLFKYSFIWGDSIMCCCNLRLCRIKYLSWHDWSNGTIV